MCVYVIMLIFVCILCYYVYSVKSSWELVFIVIQKPNQTLRILRVKKRDLSKKKGEGEWKYQYFNAFWFGECIEIINELIHDKN
jgi:hypothetical protein